MHVIRITFLRNCETNREKFLLQFLLILSLPCRLCIAFIESIEHSFIGYFVHTSFTHAIYVSTRYVTREKPRRGYPHAAVQLVLWDQTRLKINMQIENARDNNNDKKKK